MSGDQPIIIKKVKKGGGHGHHGGAWKVAYADFVTAMMAFFLLMWLINTTTPEQKRGIADYFAPASVSPSTSGSGGILAGTVLGDDGVRGRGDSSVVERLAPRAPRQDANERQQTEDAAASMSEAGAEAMASAMARREDALFASAEMSLRQALQEMPELSELSRHVIMEVTPEGLRIQLVDEDGRPMFDAGSAVPRERAVTLLRAVARVVQRLPNRLSISGHTDAAPSPVRGQSNWTLSAERANAAREVLEAAGLALDRIYEVVGKAASEPRFPDDPYLAGNRRISVLLMREAPVVPPGIDF